MRIRFLTLTGAAAASLALAFCAPASAALVTVSETYALSMPIPDDDSAGVSDTRTFSMAGATAISRVEVTLNIEGGYNGDYYAYLRSSNGGFAVLLNRVGVTAADPYGYADSGINVRLGDTALSGDIHLYQTSFDPLGGALTGLWQPDGRTADPDEVTETGPRPALLGSFTGVNPNAGWTLFVADMSSGMIGTLTGWSLSVTADITAVPEASTGLTGLFALAILWSVLQHHRAQGAMGCRFRNLSASSALPHGNRVFRANSARADH